MKILAAVMAMVVLGGGAMMGMGHSQQSAAAASAAGGVSCVLPPGQGLPAVGPWPDTLNGVHVAQVAAAAGFAGPDLTIAVAVAYAESSHRPHLTNQNTDKHRSVDYGLWQINGYYHPEQMATGDWGNPWDNGRMAFSIWKESQSWGGGWGSWVTWKKGLHTKYMADASAAVEEERKDEPFRHSSRLASARTELATVSRRLLTRYADPGTVERLDAVLGSRPPGTAQLDQAWENMRTEAVANPDLLRRWEMLTDGAGRPGVNGKDQSLPPVDQTLAGFDSLVKQLNRHAQHPSVDTATVNVGMTSALR